MPEQGISFSMGYATSSLASGSGRGEVCVTRVKFNGTEGRAEKGIRLLMAHYPSELRQMATEPFKQSLCLANNKSGISDSWHRLKPTA